MSSDDSKRYLILKDPNIIKGLFLLSLPIMIANFMRTLHDLVDTFFVSQIPDYAAEAISSISVTFPITFMYLAIGIGLSVAGTALISQYYGNAQFETARKYATNLIIVAIGIGLFLNVLSWILAPTIFRWMGTDGYVLDNAVAYIRVRSFELVPVFIFFAFRSIRQASGDTVIPTYLGVGAIVLNIILTPFMVLDQISMFGNPIEWLGFINFTIPQLSITGLGLGVPGAAFATLIANVLILPIGIYILFRTKTGVAISIKYMIPNTKVIKDLVTTAIPAALGQSVTAIGFAVLNTFIVDYGYDTYSAFSVGNRVSSLFLMPVFAIGQIMSSYIGQNIGNLNPKRAKKAFHQGLILSVSVLSIGSIIGLFIRHEMAAVFLSDEPAALELSIQYMTFLLAGLPLMAVYQAYIGLYNGTGKTMYTLIIGVTRLWLVRIPLLVIFTNYTNLGSSGIWYAMLLSNLIIAVFGLGLVRRIDYSPKIDIKPILT